MRFRAGLVTGFAAGFYCGAMAGRERYEQINRLIGKAKRSEAVDAAAGTARGVLDLGLERAKEVAAGRLGHHGNGGADRSTEDAASRPIDSSN